MKALVNDKHGLDGQKGRAVSGDLRPDWDRNSNTSERTRKPDSERGEHASARLSEGEEGAREQPLPMHLVVRARRLWGVELSDVKLIESPELERRGKRGMAVEGRELHVAPSSRSDPELLWHELVHLVQQRGGSRADTRAGDSQEAAEEELRGAEPEAEARAAAKALVAGEAEDVVPVVSAVGQGVLYQDAPVEADSGADSKAEASEEGAASHRAAPAYVDRGDWPTIERLFLEKPGSAEAVRGFVAGCSMLEPQLPIWKDGIVLLLEREQDGYGSIRWPSESSDWILKEQSAFLSEYRSAREGNEEPSAAPEAPSTDSMTSEEYAAWEAYRDQLELPAELRKVELRIDPALVCLERLDQLFELLRHELTHAMQRLAANGDYLDQETSSLELGAYYESARVSAEYELKHVDRSRAMQTLGTLAGHWQAAREEYRLGKSGMGRARVDEFVEAHDFYLNRMATLVPVEFGELRTFVFGPEVEDLPEATPESIRRPRGTRTVGELAVQVKTEVTQFRVDETEFSAGYLKALLRGELPPAAVASWERQREAMGWEKLMVELRRLEETIDRAENGGRTSGEIELEESQKANAQWENPSPIELSVFNFGFVGVTKVAEEDHARLHLWSENAKALGLESLSHIEVRGYSDDLGGTAAQLMISQQRADAVKRELVEYGIPADKIDAVGLGFVEPTCGRAGIRELEDLKKDEVDPHSRELDSYRARFRVVELMATQGGAP
ncbi:MAG: OmpA family protein [Myxococcota bacterium]|jgi:outer membrane protein OmpA-like peptidoglycan-associated protein|nr:OmpA family protein [Myxococcota bacterium]